MMSAAQAQEFAPARTEDRVWQSFQAVESARAKRASVEALLLAATDFALVWLSAAVALCFRIDAGAITFGTRLAKNAGFLVLFSILTVLFCHTQRLYQSHLRSPFDEAAAVIKAVAMATIVLSASVYLSGQAVVSRVALGITVVMSATLLISWRNIWRQHTIKRVAAGQDCRNVLILGWSERAQLLESHFAQHRLSGCVIKGFLDRRRRAVADIRFGNRHKSSATPIGHVDNLFDIIRAHFIDEVWVLLPEDRDRVKQLIAQTRAAGVDLRVIPDLYDGLAIGAPIEYLGPFPAIKMHEKPLPSFSLFLKRCVDVIGTVCAALIFFPLVVLIAVAIRIDSPGPTLYRSKRIGKKGTTFTCYKFRTMVQNADAMKEQLRYFNERSGVLFKIAKDPRITRVGRVLRKYSLDEIPQFWNVFTGDMSLVGPRPPIPGEYLQYELEHLKRLHVPPGITGLWQVEARTDPSFESYINLDTHYVDNWSIWLDLKILFRTVGVVVAGTGQ
jgi:exopolysaccharide biosynthesis polyprenyl glycosylphosphotransferase